MSAPRQAQRDGHTAGRDYSIVSVASEPFGFTFADHAADDTSLTHKGVTIKLADLHALANLRSEVERLRSALHAIAYFDSRGQAAAAQLVAQARAALERKP